MRYLFLILCSFIFISCRKPVMESQTQYVFGTVCTANLFEDGTADLYKEIFDELNAIDDKFNVNKPSSEVSEINAKAGTSEAVRVSHEVFELLQLSKKIAAITDNAFNPALGSLIRLWGIGTDHQKIPSEAEIKSALKHCRPESINLKKSDNEYTVQIEDKETQIDLGAIVKGYAADKIVELLKERNVSKAVLDFGGNIYVFGQKSKNDENALWKVGIKNPVNPDAPPVKVVSLKSGSVVTSGNYERFFESNGIRYHHILDSRTGYPAKSGLASVTVISERSVLCDALATALFVSGEKNSFKFEKIAQQDFKVVLVDLSGKPMLK